MIDLTPEQINWIKQIFSAHLPHTSVWIFGSRITSNAKKYSDLDLVIQSIEKIPSKTMSDLKQAFDESDLPFRVDLLVWCEISEEFRKVILNHYEVLI